MNAQQNAITQKASEVETSLNEWMKASGLFSPGDRLKVTIELERDQPVSVKTVNVKRGPGTKFVIESRDLSRDEWKIVSDLFLNSRSFQRIFVEAMAKAGNKPINGDDFVEMQFGKYRFNEEHINYALARAKLDIRIRAVGRNERDSNYLWQMCRVRRKPR